MKICPGGCISRRWLRRSPLRNAAPRTRPAPWMGEVRGRSPDLRVNARATFPCHGDTVVYLAVARRLQLRGQSGIRLTLDALADPVPFSVAFATPRTGAICRAGPGAVKPPYRAAGERPARHGGGLAAPPCARHARKGLSAGPAGCILAAVPGGRDMPRGGRWRLWRGQGEGRCLRPHFWRMARAGRFCRAS